MCRLIWSFKAEILPCLYALGGALWAAAKPLILCIHLGKSHGLLLFLPLLPLLAALPLACLAALLLLLLRL